MSKTSPSSLPSPPQTLLNQMLETYLDNVLKQHKKNESLELEAKFGTKGIKPITRIDYDNVVKKLKSSGFTLDTNNYLLRIQNEFMDLKTGLTQMSNIRAEINSLHDAQTYCKTNSIEEIPNEIKFVQKQHYKTKDNTKPILPANFDDFNFRVTLNNEVVINKNSDMLQAIISNWKNSKKVFRYMNRYSFTHPQFPFIVDLSIVKESDRKGGRFPVAQYTIQDSGVFEGAERYEIEIECINSKVGPGTNFSTPAALNQTIKQMVKIILAGLQETNFPISYKEQAEVQQKYMKLLWHKDDKAPQEYMKVTPKNFLGPQSYTLQTDNLVELTDSNSLLPNIRKDYTVTDKADGDRKLLYITDLGKIYLIDTNMNIQFTGAITKNKETFNSIIDGEHILHDKHQKFINLYAAFDLYFLNGRDIRTARFSPTTRGEETDKQLFRLIELRDIITKMKAVSFVEGVATSPIRIERKKFHTETPSQSIFTCCGYILQNIQDGLFEYNTDGLIFTPANLGVGSNKIGETTLPIKISWMHSFKWKPVEDNTIDFLVTIKKNEGGGDYIGNTFKSGVDTSSALQLAQFKTCILRVGFNEEVDGYLNPCQNIIEDNIPEYDDEKDKSYGKSKTMKSDKNENYVPRQFFPTKPSDDSAGICHLLLKDIGKNEKVMMTENNEMVEDNMIVEFRYVKDREELWRWIPVRVRYDKTTDFRSGGRNFGNAYRVANLVWQTIHNPITHEMITTGTNIPTEIGDDDVYYNRVTSSTGDNTKALRDFHNLFVKKLLITRVAKSGDTLIDLAVGKGGDFPKWIAAKLKFVFGVDISSDNIQNRMNGACARYLDYRKTTKEMPSALFVNGNSSINIRTGAALYSDKDKQITKAVFGQGAKDAKELGKGVYKHYGIGEEGFNVCSIQFAVHYMFESVETLHQFLRNVSETTKLGGYFIGTSYDGKDIFKLLKDKHIDESVTIMENNSKLLEITKKYSADEFPDNSSSLGYAIDVFQESINKTFREYLVNYTYFTRMLENYGFVLLPTEESAKLHLPASTGLFSDLFKSMNEELKRFPKNKSLYKEAPNMTAGERKISFLNRYFVYKKIRNVDADKVALQLMGTSVETELDEASQQKLLKEQTLINLPAASILEEPSAGVAAAAAAAATAATAAVKKAPVKKGKLKLVVKPSVTKE